MNELEIVEIQRKYKAIRKAVSKLEDAERLVPFMAKEDIEALQNVRKNLSYLGLDLYYKINKNHPIEG